MTCPQGAASIIWSPCRQRGTEAIVVRFAAAACQACPAKSLCTRSSRLGRQLSLRPREIHEAVAAARPAQATSQWKARYNIRAGVEGTMRPGHPRHRHPPRPLPRPGQDPPGAQRRRCRGQPDPAGRLVDRQAPRPDPDHPPPAARPHPRRLNPNKPTGSHHRANRWPSLCPRGRLPLPVAFPAPSRADRPPARSRPASAHPRPR